MNERLTAGPAHCAVLYVGVAAVMTGMVPYRDLDVPNPITVALTRAGPALAWLVPVVGIGAILGLASAVLSSILGQSRIFYAMARDGLLPRLFLAVHPRFGTPLAGTIIVGGLAALIAGLFPIEVLGELVSIGTLLAFMSVCLNVIILRRSRPELPRTFRVPWSPLVPSLGIVCCAVLMLSLPPATWVRLLVWMGLGLLIYYLLPRQEGNSSK